MKNCECNDFKENIKIIDDIIILVSIRCNRNNLLGDLNFKKFEYCPWCGKKLKEVK